jgi:hypothetical protein
VLGVSFGPRGERGSVVDSSGEDRRSGSDATDGEDGRKSRRRRPSWWSQAAIIALILWAYDAINNLSPLRHAAAIAHGVDIVNFERRLHLDPEMALNRWLSPHIAFGRVVGDYYDVLHFVVTLGVLGWVWWRHPQRYRLLRNALIGINVVGFVVFWLFPVAPPRMLSSFGFVDVIAVTHAVGAWSTGAFASQANEYAAMPSLHVAWALWCAFAVWAVCKDWFRRTFICVYVVTTALVVMATANHYFMDVMAGAATATLSAAVAVWWYRRRRRRAASVGALHATVDLRWDGDDKPDLDEGALI